MCDRHSEDAEDTRIRERHGTFAGAQPLEFQLTQRAGPAWAVRLAARPDRSRLLYCRAADAEDAGLRKRDVLTGLYALRALEECAAGEALEHQDLLVVGDVELPPAEVGDVLDIEVELHVSAHRRVVREGIRAYVRHYPGFARARVAPDDGQPSHHGESE